MFYFVVGAEVEEIGYAVVVLIVVKDVVVGFGVVVEVAVVVVVATVVD